MAPLYPNSVPRTIGGKIGDFPSFLDFGTTDGVHDVSDTLNTAIQSVMTAGRGSLYVPAGTYVIGNSTPTPTNVSFANVTNFTLYGDPEKTIFIRGGTMPTGQGIFDIPSTAAGIRIKGIHIDGAITTPTGLLYSAIPGGDPAASILTNNSMIWVHGGAQDISIEDFTLTHGSGYGIFIDARTGGIINNVQIIDGKVINHRPFLFGVSDPIYGSWVGAVFVKNLSDGTNAFYTSNLDVKNCKFERVTGNVIWCHSNNFDQPNINFNINGNQFDYNGLDAVELGNVKNATVQDNNIHACGYITTTDTDTPTPAINPGLGPAAIDTTSNVYGANYNGNTITNIVGEYIDGDGLYDSVISGNTLTLSDPTDPWYSIDQVSSYPTGACTGIQPSNTYEKNGSSNLTITSNTIYNMSSRSISMSNCRNCVVANNTIWQSGSSALAPIIIFCTDNSATNGGTAQQNRAWGNLVTANNITYGSDTNASSMCIVEANPNSNEFVNTDPPNRVFGNVINPIGLNYGEWYKDANSSSFSGYHVATEDNASTSNDTSLLQRIGTGASAVTRISKFIGQSTLTELMQISDAGFLNVSVGGAAGTGAIGLANRSATAFTDVFAGGKTAVDAFASFTDSTFTNADANTLPATYGLIKYVSSTNTFQISTAVSAGARVWTNLVSSVAGSDQDVLYNKANAVFGDGNFKWNYVSQVLNITGVAATSALNVLAGYITSAGGLVTSANSWEGIQSATDGALLCGYAVGQTASNTGGYYSFAPITYGSSTFPIPLNGLASFGTNTILLWGSSTNGTVSPITSFSLMTNAAINSAVGFVTENTNVSSIQAPQGGVNAKYLIGTTSFTLLADTFAHAGLSTAGQGRIYFDSTANQFLVSQNAGAYAALSTIAGTDEMIQYNKASVDGADNNLRWNYGNQVLIINGITATAGLDVIGSYISADQGFTTNSSAANAVQALSGGMTALQFISTRNDAGPCYTLNRTTSTAQQWSLDINSSGSFVLQNVTNNAPYLTVSTTGTFNFGTTVVIDQTGDIVATGVLQLTGTGASGLVVTNSTNTNAIQVPNGGITAKYLVGTTSLTLTAATSSAAGLSSGGQGRIYFDSTSNRFMVSENAGAYVNLTGGGVTSITGTANEVIASASTGAITLSLPQPIATTSNVTFNAIALSSSLTNALGIINGGVAAKYLIASTSITMSGDTSTNAGLSVAGSGRIYFDSTLNKFQVSENTGAFVNLVPTSLVNSIAGTNNEIVASSSTGAITLSLPQQIATSSNVTFNAIALSSSQTNALGVASGGVQAKYLIGTTSLTMVGDTSTNAGLSTTGQGRIYFDSSVNQFLVSQNAGSYVPLVSAAGVTSITGTANEIIASSSTGAITLSLPQPIATSSNVTFSALALSSSLTNALGIASGGVTASFLIGTTSLTLAGNTAGNAGLSSGGQGRIYFDSSQNQFLVSQNGNAYIPLVGTGVSSLTGTANEVIVSSSTGAITLSLPQPIATSSNVTFSALALSSSLTNALGIASGGVTAAYLVGTTSFTLTSTTSSTAGLSTTGQGRIYFDSSLNKFQVSENTGAYVNLVPSSVVTSIAGTSNEIIASSSTGAITLSLPQQIATNSNVTFSALALSSSLTNALGIASGGVTASFLIGTTSLTMVGNSAGNAGLSTTGQGRIYFDSSINQFLISQNGSAYVPLIAASGVTSITGTTNQVITSSSTGAITLSLPQSISTSSSVTFSALALSSSATNALGIASGGVSAAYLIGTTSFTLIGNTSSAAGLSSGGQGRIYFDSTSNRFMVSENGNTYINLTGTGVTSITGTANEVISSGSTGAITLSLPQAINTAANVSFSTISLSSGSTSSVFTSGGVTANYFISDTSLSIIGNSLSNAGTSGAGFGRIYFDSSLNKFQVSENGGSYVNLVPSSVVTSIAGTSNEIIASSSTGAIILSLPQQISTSSNVTFNAIALSSSATNALGVASGGVTASYLIGTTSLTLTGNSSSNAGLSTSGQGRIYFDSSQNQFLVSQNGGAYAPLVGSSSAVTEVLAGTGVSVNQNTGNVTVSIGQPVSTSSSVTFNQITAGSLVIDGGFVINGSAAANFNVLTVTGSGGTSSIANGLTVSSGSIIIGSVIFDSTSGLNRTDVLQVKAPDATMSMQATNADDYSGLLMLDNNGVEAASFQYANASAGFQPGNFFVAARTSGSSLIFCSNGLNVRQTITSTGEVRINSGQITLSPISTPINATNGAMYYNSSTNLFQVFQNGSWVGISGGGVTSVGGATGAVTLIGSNGVTVSGTTISIGQPVATTSSPTFANVVSNGYFDSTASGSSTAFTTSSGTFTVSGDGTVGCQILNTNTVEIGSTTVINTSRQFIGTGVTCQTGPIIGTAFDCFLNGAQYTGQSWTIAISGSNFVITNTIGGGSVGTFSQLLFAGGVLSGV